MRSQLVRLAGASAAVIMLASCSSGSHSHGGTAAGTGTRTTAASQGPGAVQQVTINATSSFRFDPPTVTAHTGTLRVRLVDVGAYPHNLSVGPLHTTSDTVTGGAGKDMTTFMLTFNHPGTYGFFCTFHSSAGMRGQFVIR